jgi:excisionase family DNA binding protein
MEVHHDEPGKGSEELEVPRARDNSNNAGALTRRLYRPYEVCEILGLSRDMFFAIIRTGEMRSIKVGRLRLVPAEAIDEYVAMKLAQNDVANGRQ